MRVRQDSHIFFSTGGMPQFTDDLAVPEQWESILPPLTFYEAMAVDSSLAEGFNFGFQTLDSLGQAIQARGGSPDEVIRSMIVNGNNGIMESLKSVGALDVVRSLRGLVGAVAITVGFMPQEMNGPVRTMYKQPLQQVARFLDYANKVFSNKYFQEAVEGIAWIPIIGWIIKILVDVLSIVAKIADHVRTKRMKGMSAEMAQRFHLPILRDHGVAHKYNEEMVRAIMRWTQDFQLWRAFQPPAIIPGGDGKWFEVKAARDSERGPDYDLGKRGKYYLSDLWYMRPVAEAAAIGAGGGFMPGGVDIIRMLEFRPEYGGAHPTNTGDYAPTARQMAGYLWSTVLSRGPALFTVNANQTRDHWDAYVHGMLEFGDRCIRKGQTFSRSAVQTYQDWENCSGQEWCGPWNERPSGDCSRGSHHGRKYSIPVSHIGPLMTWVAEQFWGRGPEKTNFPFDIRNVSKDWDPDHYYYDNTTYAHALDNLWDRQRQIIKGYEALSVFPGDEFETDDGHIERSEHGIFPAFGRPGNWNNRLIEEWENTLKLIIEDESAWSSISYTEIPQYRWKGQSPREIVKEKQLAKLGWLVAKNGAGPALPGGPDQFPPSDPPDLTGTGKEGVLQNPEEVAPPPPPSPRPPPPMPPASRAMVAGGGAMAAVGLGAILTRQVRKYFT